MDWNNFPKKIAEAARASFLDVIACHEDEDFYAFSLCTDSSAMTVVPAANSLQALKKSTANISEKSLASLAYYKWTTSEWAYEGWKAEEFREISAELRDSKNRDQFSAFKTKVLKAMIEALKILDRERCFENKFNKEKIVLFVTITDDEQAEYLENDSAKQLNSISTYQAFLNRFNPL